MWCPERQTAHLIEPTLQNNTALLLTAPHKYKRLQCDCTSSWRNESAVITAACKCIQAGRRHIDFSISDWPSVIAQRALREAGGGETLSLIDAVMERNRL